MTAVVGDAPEPCRNAGPLAPVLLGLLAKDPKTRLDADRAREMLAAISRGADPEATASWSPVARHDETRAMPAVLAPVPAPGNGRRRRFGVVLLVLLVLAAGGGVAGWLVTRHGGGKHGAAAAAADGPFDPGQGGVPADWVKHTAPAGWSVATPANWHLEQQGAVLR